MTSNLILKPGNIFLYTYILYMYMPGIERGGNLEIYEEACIPGINKEAIHYSVA